ncbi:MAG: nickel insertion protein, partial [Candidatus Competibacteraceae bacterium]|nr:nickel insertion protein [Candidatus Competibacteraceae bacterium]
MPLHLHLDPLGGVAGDMFVGALLDAWPELESPLQTALAEADLTRLITVRQSTHRDHTLSGSRFEVEPVQADNHDHRSFQVIRDLLSEIKLGEGVKQQALAIFQLLADAEGRVHGVASEQVQFHEVGAWDSIADIVCAAWLIDRLNIEHWSCAPLPMGRGRVMSAHGWLPVPAPATTLLLEGFPLFQDDLDGERITPTG